MGTIPETHITALNRSQILFSTSLVLNQAETPIYRIPDELLVRVFRAVVSLTPWPKGELRALLSLTHVCRCWRSTALQYPLLWTQVWAGNRELAEAFLRRSGSADVDVTLSHADLSSALAQEFSDLIRPHSHRVSALTLRCNAPGVVDIFAFLKYPLANLSRLDINASLSKVHHWPAPRPPIVVDPVVGTEQRPLHSLTLRSAIIPFTSPLFRDLRSLSLFDQNRVDTVPPTLETFLDVLQGCPNLESLVIERAGPRCQIPHYNPGRFVELPHMRSLTTEKNEAEDIAGLLDHLILSPTTILSLSTQVEGGPDFLSLLPTTHKLACTAQITELYLMEDWHSNDLILRGCHDGRELVSVLVNWGIDGNGINERCLTSIGSYLGHCPVRFLSITGDFSFTLHPGMWRDFYRTFSKLDELQIDLSSEECSDESHIPIQELGSTDVAEIGSVCPRLKRLKLDGFECSGAFVKTIKQCLEIRESMGATRLEELIVVEREKFEEEEGEEDNEASSLELLRELEPRFCNSISIGTP